MPTTWVSGVFSLELNKYIAGDESPCRYDKLILLGQFKIVICSVPG